MGWIARERMMFISVSALLISSLLLRRIPSYSLSDLKTVYFLFLLFTTTRSLERSEFFDSIAFKLRGRRAHGIVFASAFLSALVTNDVSLFITVPITLSLDIPSGDKEKLVILEAIVANGFSALTPFGNPQNIFIHVHYSLKFLRITETIYPLPIAVLLLALLLSGRIRIGLESAKYNLSKGWWVDLISLIIVALAVIDLVPDFLTVVSLAIVLRRPSVLKGIDYPLLITFLAFFGFTDNLKSFLNVSISGKTVFLSTVALSQLISNVPATLIMADFTSDWKGILWGSNVGGFGTLVASLANLIAYRMYGFSVLKFTLYNIAFLVMGITLGLIFT